MAHTHTYTVRTRVMGSNSSEYNPMAFLIDHGVRNREFLNYLNKISALWRGIHYHMKDLGKLSNISNKLIFRLIFELDIFRMGS
jgi:hypothetical protein